MNNIIVILMFFLLSIMSSCSDKQINTEPGTKIIASYTESEMIIDGSLTESIWQKTQSVVLRENKTGKSLTDSMHLTVVQTAYDQDNLYIAFICNDTDIWGNFSDRDQHLWTEEAIEVFIDTDSVENTYVEIEVSPKNVVFDSYIVDPVNIDIAATKEFDLSGLKSAVWIEGSLNDESDIDLSWHIEIGIPIKEIVGPDSKIVSGVTEWRINFYRIERDHSGNSQNYAWSPTNARFHKPSAFGTLIFE